MEEHIIRVHTAEGRVYARLMQRMDFGFGMDVMYAVVRVLDLEKMIPEPVASQQDVVNRLRGQGWTVEQDHGTDFNNPEWGE